MSGDLVGTLPARPEEPSEALAQDGRLEGFERAYLIYCVV